MFGELEERLGYKFKDDHIVQVSLTHRSVQGMFNNERLEFLGDAVMDLVVGEYLFRKFKSTKEGNLSKLRAALVNEESFAKIARAILVDKFIFLSNSEDNNNGRKKDSILSDAFEALIGAVYLESGFENVQKIAINLLEKTYPKINLQEIVKDYKTMLQEITQAKMGEIPTYKLIYQKGPDHAKEFKIGVFIGEKEYGCGVGKSKKQAQQIAAQNTLKMIEK